MPEQLRPFGTSLVRQCPQGLFRPDLKSTHSPWVSEEDCYRNPSKQKILEKDNCEMQIFSQKGVTCRVNYSEFVR